MRECAKIPQLFVDAESRGCRKGAAPYRSICMKAALGDMIRLEASLCCRAPHRMPTNASAIAQIELQRQANSADSSILKRGGATLASMAQELVAEAPLSQRIGPSCTAIEMRLFHWSSHQLLRTLT